MSANDVHDVHDVPDVPDGPAAAPQAAREVFGELLAHVMSTADRFGHAQHLRLTWLAVRRLGVGPAIDVVSDGIRHTARYAGAPQEYNATITRAWVELVGHLASADGDPDFESFCSAHPELLDKHLLGRFYRSSTLASEAARSGWVAPDLAPFPWSE